MGKRLSEASSVIHEPNRTLACDRKGMGLKFPNLDRENKSLRGLKRGNANELGDVSESPGKSFLFFLRDGHPGMGSTRDRVVVPAKRHGSCGVRCALAGP
jgi:hypothetical protein